MRLQRMRTRVKIIASTVEQEKKEVWTDTKCLGAGPKADCAVAG